MKIEVTEVKKSIEAQLVLIGSVVRCTHGSSDVLMACEIPQGQSTDRVPFVSLLKRPGCMIHLERDFMVDLLRQETPATYTTNLPLV